MLSRRKLFGVAFNQLCTASITSSANFVFPFLQVKPPQFDDKFTAVRFMTQLHTGSTPTSTL